MDVLRDMESHARENTRVELGGVMLGRQHVDSDGQPFVVISDSLRAKHYEATKGSFKFTHETWNQITRERNEYRSDLEMIGWYHTHPGWGVFLSGMDLFICNNFFSRPLDVALVIEPCAGQRGWFQWENGETRQTQGFYLISNRHRQNELNYFSDIFNNQNPTINDPRFKQASFGVTDPNQGESMVNVIDNRRPVFELAIVSMLFLQMLMAGFFGYRLLNDMENKDTAVMAERMAALESKLDQDRNFSGVSVREQAYANILEKVVAKETGEAGLAEDYADVAVSNKLLSENLEGQLARIAQAKEQNDELNYNLLNQRKRAEELETELLSAQDSILEFSIENKELKDSIAAADGDPLAQEVLPPWLINTLAGAGLFIAGAIGGSLIVRRMRDEELDDPAWEDVESVAEDRAGKQQADVGKNRNDSQKVAR